jgi:hypothetical protein
MQNMNYNAEHIIHNVPGANMLLTCIFFLYVNILIILFLFSNIYHFIRK